MWPRLRRGQWGEGEGKAGRGQISLGPRGPRDRRFYFRAVSTLSRGGIGCDLHFTSSTLGAHWGTRRSVRLGPGL